MTVATLERIELEDYAFAIECDDERCSAAAECTVRTICCPRLLCELHKTNLLEWVAQATGTGVTACCAYHLKPIIQLTKISDFILSVDKL